MVRRDLGTEWLFGDLHHQGLAFAHGLFYRHLMTGFFSATAGRSDIRNVQEGGALQADVQKRGAHAGQHPAHSAQVDIADQATIAGAFDGEFLQHAIFDEGDPRLLRRDVD